MTQKIKRNKHLRRKKSLKFGALVVLWWQYTAEAVIVVSRFLLAPFHSNAFNVKLKKEPFARIACAIFSADRCRASLVVFPPDGQEVDRNFRQDKNSRLILDIVKIDRIAFLSGDFWFAHGLRFLGYSFSVLDKFKAQIFLISIN